MTNPPNAAWRSVPVEPTRDMIEAASVERRGDPLYIWRLMIAASPPAPAADAPAWIKHDGRSVPPLMVDVRTRDGTERFNEHADNWLWKWREGVLAPGDIMEFRVAVPAADDAKLQALWTDAEAECEAWKIKARAYQVLADDAVTVKNKMMDQVRGLETELVALRKAPTPVPCADNAGLVKRLRQRTGCHTPQGIINLCNEAADALANTAPDPTRAVVDAREIDALVSCMRERIEQLELALAAAGGEGKHDD